MSLGVGDQGPVAALGQVADSAWRLSPSGPGAGSSRIQRPSPSDRVRSSSSSRASTAVSATSPPVRIVDRDPLAAQAAVERLDPARDLVDAHVVIVADVRRGADRLDPVGDRLPRQGGAVDEVERAVVDSGKDVAVQINHPRFAQVNLVQGWAQGGTRLRSQA